MKYRFTSAALTELTVATQRYESKEIGLGSRFLDEVDNAVILIRSNPEAWRPLTARTRRCLVHDFPFGVIYQIRSDELLIVSVMDLRTDPKSWKKYLE